MVLPPNDGVKDALDGARPSHLASEELGKSVRFDHHDRVTEGGI